ncbi:transposase [Petrotoga sp. 9PW.55.5.1]|nr:transposase [Petrotoga sp. 9PW.55.5.1]
MYVRVEKSSFIERMYGDKYSAGSISNLTNVVLEDVKKWQERK